MMGAKFRSEVRDGFIWLTAVVAGVTYWLHKQGRVGECGDYRGKKMKGE